MVVLLSLFIGDLDFKTGGNDDYRLTLQFGIWQLTFFVGQMPG